MPKMNALLEEAGSTDCCRVCGAAGAGRHYGSVCCSGCKGFFRRSVRFQKLYRCPYGQQCAISKMYRNFCRACRYQKCLQMGLDPNLVQSDWGHCGENGRAKGRPPKLMKSEVKEEPREESPETEELISIKTTGVLAEMCGTKGENGGTFPLLWHNHALNGQSQGQSALGAVSRIGMPQHHFPDSNEALALADYLVQVERYCDFFSGESPTSPNGAQFAQQWDLNVPLELAFRQPTLVASRTPIGWHPKELEQGGPIFGALFSRLLVHCFDWASHLPELMCLDDEDKRLLLKRRTMRSMWWLVSRRSVPFQKGPQGMLVGGEMFYPREPALQAKLDPALRGLLTDAVNMAYDQLILPMREHGVSEAESALLRAIAFFTPVARLSAEGHRQVLYAQNKYLGALTQLVMQRPFSEDTAAKSPMERMGRLLMFLTALEQVSRIGDDTFSMFCTFNMNGMCGSLAYEIHTDGS